MTKCTISETLVSLLGLKEAYFYSDLMGTKMTKTAVIFLVLYAIVFRFFSVFLHTGGCGLCMRAFCWKAYGDFFLLAVLTPP